MKILVDMNLSPAWALFLCSLFSVTCSLLPELKSPDSKDNVGIVPEVTDLIAIPAHAYYPHI